MKVDRNSYPWRLSLVSISLCAIAGCQGGLTSLPSLNNFNNPSRVPPPPTGSFQVPPGYADPAGGGSTATRPRPTTLGQLRSIETGKSVGDKIGSDGTLATEVTNNAFAFTSKPVINQAPVIDQAFSTMESSSNSVRTASTGFAPELNGPAIVPASSLNALPDPRNSQAANGSLSSDGENVKWKSSQQR